VFERKNGLTCTECKGEHHFLKGKIGGKAFAEKDRHPPLPPAACATKRLVEKRLSKKGGVQRGKNGMRLKVTEIELSKKKGYWSR